MTLRIRWLEKSLLKKKLVEIFIKSKNYKNKKGINFFTKTKYPFQVASMQHKKNHIINPHIHKNYTRKINNTSEVLIIQSGEIEVHFYNNKKKIVKKISLKKDDIIIFFTGSHGFKIKKNSRFIEVKQGPYNKKTDKILI